MEKRRIRLEINGVVCGLITQESEEYMAALSNEVGELMREVLEASPFVTREAAALTAALSYCDDAKKNGKKAEELQERVDELEVEAEIWQEEKAGMEQAKPDGPDPDLLEKLRALEEKNTALEEAVGKLREAEEKAARLEDENAALREAVASQAEAAPRTEAVSQAETPFRPASQAGAQPRPASQAGAAPRHRNPLRHEDEYEQEGFVSFFEKQ